MINKPKFKDHFHVEVAEPKVVFLLSEKGHFALRGRLYALVAPLINGHHTVEEITEQLQGQVAAAEVAYTLQLLEQKGYITEADSTLPTGVAAFWRLLGIDSKLATQRLQETRVSVTTYGNVPTGLFISTLKSLNIPISNEGDFAVVLTDDYLQVGLDAFNQESLIAQRPWLLVKPVGAVVWIGPLFRPGLTGCWDCLAQRLRANREIESSLQANKGTSVPFPVSRSALPSTLHTGFNIAATEIAKGIACPELQSLEGKLITFDLVNLSLQDHVLVRRPQCPCCGDREYYCQQKPQLLELASQKKLSTGESGHRGYPLEQTLSKYKHHISPITGVVNTLFSPASGRHDLFYAYVAEHSFPRQGNSAHLQQALPPRSFGKGRTDLQAKLSALGEAIERYSGSFTGDELRVTGNYSGMEDAIHPYACFHYSDAQYRDRQAWNQRHHPIQWIPDPFDPVQDIEWTPAWSLSQQRLKYLPTAYCYYGYPIAKDHCFCWPDTNGNAAGNTKEEAIFQGFMELVERDAVALWWYNRLSKPVVDLESFAEPYLQSLKAYYRNLCRDFWVLDLTSDLDIPTFAAISPRTDHQPADILFGFGTHFDCKIALLRAVMEMNQMVFLSNGANPASQAKFSRPDIQVWCQTATLENQPYLVPDTRVAAKVYTDYPQYRSDDLCRDVITCVEVAAKHGLETLVLDQTRPDIGMSVVKVVVPGLRHFWAQFAPGRLYDVPVQLGWLPASLTEDQLNPIPMFI